MTNRIIDATPNPNRRPRGSGRATPRATPAPTKAQEAYWREYYAQTARELAHLSAKSTPVEPGSPRRHSPLERAILTVVEQRGSVATPALPRILSRQCHIEGEKTVVWSGAFILVRGVSESFATAVVRLVSLKQLAVKAQGAGYCFALGPKFNHHHTLL